MLRILSLKLLLIIIVGMLGRGSVPLATAENGGLASDFGGFGVGGIVADAPLMINDMALLPDGRIVAVGAQGATFAVARFLPSGALDPSFGANGLAVTPVTTTQTSAAAHSIAVQPDGRLVVAGTVTGEASSDFAVLRLLPDGALDASFGSGGRVVVDFAGGDDSAASVALDHANRVVVAGSADLANHTDFVVLRLLPDGALDTTFDGNGKSSVDFGGDAGAVDLLIQSTKEIVLVGHARVAATTGDARTVFALARLGENGMRDSKFDEDGMLTTSITGDDVASSVTLDVYGKLVVAGTGAEGMLVVARYFPTGTLDDSFDGDGILSAPMGSTDSAANAVLTMPNNYLSNNSIVVAGRSGSQMFFARYNEDGMPDSGFAGDGMLLLETVPGATDGANSLLVSRDGRLLAGGGPFMARLFIDGTLDAGGRQVTEFTPASINNLAFATLVQPDGKIVSVGIKNFNQPNPDLNLALTRHLPDGQLDPSFGSGGTYTLVGPTAERGNGALLQPDGKIVVVGYSSQNQAEDVLLARFNADGSPDAACGDGGVRTIDIGGGITDQGIAVALQADGKMLVAGITYYPTTTRAFVLRLQPDCGFPDPSFGRGGVVELTDASRPIDLVVLPDGQIQFFGRTAAGGAVLARFSPDGSPDDRFGSSGKVMTPLEMGEARAAAALPDGKLLVAAAHVTAGEPSALLLRYTSTGELDPSFGTGGMIATDLGPSQYPIALAVRGDGAFALAANSATQLGSAVALFNANGSRALSFGDGGQTRLVIGGRTVTRDAIFSGDRLIIGGLAATGSGSSFALAAYSTGGQGPALGFVPAAVTLAESRAAATLTVSLSQTSAQTVTVQYAATGGTATNGADYTLAAGMLTFAPGQVAQRIAVSLIDDSAAEGDETVVVALSGPSNAVLGDAASFTLTIADDDTGSPVPNPSPAPRSGMFLPLVQR